jgi:3-deoxy-manno-octulosonate cytidylyltransferase (CMP-KDO synthetase)
MKRIIVIPARLSSTRLPNKVLLDLHGKSVVQRVYEQCLKAKNIDAVYIATDSKEVQDACLGFTPHVIMTSTEHQSGTDRIAEAVKDMECDVVINVQGDEPFIDPTLIDKLSNAFNEEDTVMVSAMHKIEETKDLINPNVVKVTVDKNAQALYFSRSLIPFPRDDWKSISAVSTVPDTLHFYRHLGIYGYSKNFLLTYAQMKPSYLESVEKLEQLRVLENGYKIKMVETDYNSIGIDTQDDYEKALALIKN